MQPAVPETDHTPVLRVPSPADGDCLFFSIRVALQTYRGQNALAVRQSLTAVGIDVETMTATDLRRIVYALFLLPNKETDDIMAQWQALVTVDPELAIEYGQARCLIGKNIAALTADDRAQFFTACMDRRITWGDEFALYVLERLLCIRCMVVFNGVMQLRRYDHGLTFAPLVYIPLQLRGSHYETVSIHAQSAFARAEIPSLLLRMAHRDCGTAQEAYIHLRVSDIETADAARTDADTDIDTVLVPLREHLQLCQPIMALIPIPIPSSTPTRTLTSMSALSSASASASASVPTRTPGIYPPRLPRTRSIDTETEWDTDADADVEPDADADADAEMDIDDQRLIDLNDGTIHMGVLPKVITRLQCGLAIPFSSTTATVTATATVPVPVPVLRTKPFATRLIGKQPVFVW